MKRYKVSILHNIVRIPIIVINIPILAAALILNEMSTYLKKFNRWYGNVLIKKYKLNEQK